ncbi:right-handed parallel beta-helix repeat-containing protein [Siccirubricoccus sp. KC 17139]|uniref:Right-handed parallel beta-helix repeat-containing protein n=1 Tax=Siccirubricoccus soli TaxID=2899147 RepID=A0ABT1DAK8_9PROT|nr:right-handed parallel beta-helix repeat-containing protein [Siccirubricoccus soli]MCO6418972.1 right-handed parallel beta-helix repeat-containing protein [Siccirubricoccus soli]MCP2685107.1 right-handed parallel beta-helix repeat-containing protein [Siccirubricoccus soli]
MYLARAILSGLIALLAVLPGRGATADMVIRCEGDVTEALQAAVGAGTAQSRPIILEAPTEGARCGLRRGLTIPPGMQFLGRNQPVLALTASGRAFTGNAQSGGFRIADLTVDASAASDDRMIYLRGTPSGRIENMRLIRPGGGIILTGGTHDVAIARLTVIESRHHAVAITDSYNNSIDDADLEGQRGFGVVLDGTSHHNRLNGLRTSHSGLELVGMTSQTSYNVLTNSTASRTGDNCFSITGSHNRLANLSGSYCVGAGITFYGSYNTLENGRFVGNGQQHWVRPAWSAGVLFAQGFGGVAQHNTVRNVVVDDDQPQPTQQVGVMALGAYEPWAPRHEIRANFYRYVGLRLYRATSAGITGPTPPSGDGPVSDGGVTWVFVNSFDRTTLPDNNRAEHVEVLRAGRAPREDRSGAPNNQGTR